VWLPKQIKKQNRDQLSNSACQIGPTDPLYSVMVFGGANQASGCEAVAADSRPCWSSRLESQHLSVCLHPSPKENNEVLDYGSKLEGSMLGTGY
jgi:hypothetical protein